MIPGLIQEKKTVRSNYNHTLKWKTLYIEVMNEIPYIYTTNIVQDASHQKILHSDFFMDQCNIKDHQNSS